MNFNHRLILRTASMILLFEGIAMLIPFAFACYFAEFAPATAFFCIIVVCVSFGITINRVTMHSRPYIHSREGFYIVIVCWMFVILLGSMPYLLSDMGYSFWDCWFESTAGWTTTGATVLGYDNMPRSLLLWKSVSSWLGGMGIIVLTTSIFPKLGIRGQKMAAAEMPGPTLEKLTARFGDTAKISYQIYTALTLIELLLLIPTKMTFYDALLNTLSSISTAGIVDLSNAQDAFVITPYIKGVLSFFSMASSVNFIAYFMLTCGKFREALHHYEVRVYLLVIAAAGLMMGVDLHLHHIGGSLASSIGNALVQGISFASTSGFIIDDIGSWPTFSKFMLLTLSLIGGCSFSTSGGMKIIRFSVFLKLISRGIYKRIHPRAIKPVMIQKKPVSAPVASSITMFILLYFGLFMFSAIVLSLNNLDMETTLSAVAGAFTNTGTSFGRLTGSDFSIFAAPFKFYLSLLMLAGRLEMYAVIIMFSPSYWNSDRARV